MIIRGEKANRKSKYSVIVCILIALFSIFNVYNSALFGQYTANRTYVYYTIGVIIAAELVYLIFTSKGRLTVNWVTSTLFVILSYILILNYFKGISAWTILVHCGTLFLWICSFKFVNRSCSTGYGNISSYLMLVNGLFYLFAILSIIAQKNIAEIKGQNVAVVNLSYYCLACFPITMLDSNKSKRIFNVVIAISTSIYSLKRGAIITVVLMLIFYYYVDGKINKKAFSSWIKVAMAGGLIIIAVLIVDYYSGGFLLARFTRTSLLDGSGRSKIISSALYQFSNRGIGERLFGTGSGTSTSTIGITLHNDFWEFLYCFGYIGLIMYLGFAVSFIVRLRLYIKNHKMFSNIFAMIIAFIIGLSLFEGVLLNFAFLYVVIQTAVIDCMYVSGIQYNGANYVA